MKLILHSVLILALSVLLTKWLVALDLLAWLLQTETGLDLYASATNTLGIIGGEDGEFMLLALTVFVMLVPSAFLVGVAAKRLHTFRAKRQSAANKRAGR
ncbi:hypothetical protein [Pseudomonas syringae]|uniref:hypothetical protein n=1 Tax=Pseudomonas TaxID=286 RepID=UPI000CDB931A|nr:hypothetical protein [Pseudomonas syringae]MCF5391752.1 hypothetical protein [Pseudomonas syringae]MCH5553173.1 hypothetical protein [Pseudomonas syringae pv. syringae]MCH5575054.1 hypothetical protein [Pseudomonas syringae pv. syringae]MCH5665554.1 hypothetical protein [Pseudomonas syringae pv. syringae]POR72732.1 hypothetical protein BKM27_01795 [Pseudomonas syringae pv. syringae]